MSEQKEAKKDLENGLLFTLNYFLKYYMDSITTQHYLNPYVNIFVLYWKKNPLNFRQERECRVAAYKEREEADGLF